MINLPDSLIEQLDGVNKVLLVGAGGGFDLLATLPVYYSLLNEYEVDVELANYSFVHFPDLDKINDTVNFQPNVQGATGNIKNRTNHFPEGYLSEYLANGFGRPQNVWMINSKQSMSQLTNCYNNIIKHMKIEAIIACGFGVRSIMTGNEQDCGDMAHTTINLGALNDVSYDIPKVLITTAFELNSRKAVSYFAAMENMSKLIAGNAYYGGFINTKHMASYQFLKSSYEWIATQPEHDTSPLIESFFMSTEGGFGPHNVEGTMCNPIMCQSHIFDLPSVMSINQIAPLIKGTTDYATMVQSAMSLINQNNQRATQIFEM